LVREPPSLLWFDGSNGLETVQRFLREKGVSGGCSINFFEKEKRDSAN